MCIRDRLNIMYRVDGSSDLTEEIVEGFDGYRGSSPVRIGNGAADQLQLDIYGEFLDALLLIDEAGYFLGNAGWADIIEIIDWLCDNWDRPEEGIWETRGGQRRFVYGRLMTWVAFDRAIDVYKRQHRHSAGRGGETVRQRPRIGAGAVR